MTKKEIYDEMCALLTDYENQEELFEEDDIDWAEEMYRMLVKIQTRWEDTITT